MTNDPFKSSSQQSPDAQQPQQARSTPHTTLEHITLGAEDQVNTINGRQLGRKIGTYSDMESARYNHVILRKEKLWYEGWLQPYNRAPKAQSMEYQQYIVWPAREVSNDDRTQDILIDRQSFPHLLIYLNSPLVESDENKSGEQIP